MLSAAPLLAGLLLGADALTLAPREPGRPLKVVQHEIARRHVENPLLDDRRRRLRKRAGTVNVGLQNEETLYFMNVSLGTPAQNLRLQIDTGSSDMWVNVPDSQECQQTGSPCSASGTFDASSSTTYHFVNNEFNISYVDGSGASGNYATDTLRFNDITIQNQQFGMGNQSSSKQSLLGIGYSNNEASVTAQHDDQYPNLPQNLVSNGYINTNAYSLWLNDLDANTGSILFGGVNSDKYTGSLQTLPIIQEDSEYVQFIIGMTAVGTNGNEGSIVSSQSIPALLDSGSSLLYLPDSIAQDIYTAFDISYDANEGVGFVNCSFASSDDTIDFTFSSPRISVSMSELVLVGEIENGVPTCIFALAPSGGDSAVLGDAFLRSAYVVYDLGANEISLAQTKFNSTSDHIQEITNSSGVPGATSVRNAATAIASVSDDARLGQPTVTTSSSWATATAMPGGAMYEAAFIGAAGAVMAMAL